LDLLTFETHTELQTYPLQTQTVHFLKRKSAADSSVGENGNKVRPLEEDAHPRRIGVQVFLGIKAWICNRDAAWEVREPVPSTFLNHPKGIKVVGHRPTASVIIPLVDTKQAPVWRKTHYIHISETGSKRL
jgi:hypothetical protein